MYCIVYFSITKETNIIKNTAILFILFLIIPLFSCKSNKMFDNNILEDRNKFSDIEIVLLDTDYRIIKYIENSELEIEITNSERIIQLDNLIISDDLVNYNPIIYILIYNKMYLSKGMWVFSSAVPQNCDFVFWLKADGRITFTENNRIHFRKWK